jgi:hypothetical protein
LEAEDSEILKNHLIELMTRKMYIGLEYIPKHVICVETYHVSLGLCMVLNTSVEKVEEKVTFSIFLKYLLDNWSRMKLLIF